MRGGEDFVEVRGVVGELISSEKSQRMTFKIFNNKIQCKLTKTSPFEECTNLIGHDDEGIRGPSFKFNINDAQYTIPIAQLCAKINLDQFDTFMKPLLTQVQLTHKIETLREYSDDDE